MTIADVVKVLNGKLMAGDAASPRVVGAVVANDLMSDVLLFDADDALLLTSLASDQAIRTAHIVGAMGVVVHNAKPLSETMIKVANDLHIPLVSSPLSKYDACVKMHDALEMEKRAEWLWKTIRLRSSPASSSRTTRSSRRFRRPMRTVRRGT